MGQRASKLNKSKSGGNSSHFGTLLDPKNCDQYLMVMENLILRDHLNMRESVPIIGSVTWGKVHQNYKKMSLIRGCTLLKVCLEFICIVCFMQSLKCIANANEYCGFALFTQYISSDLHMYIDIYICS